MYDEIVQLSRYFLDIANRSYQRYFIQQTPVRHRGLILLGQRGIGKTTTLVQYLLQHTNGELRDPRILYVPADHILVSNESLYRIAESFHGLGGELIAFDEIHKYSNWSQELKSIYDTFPKLTVLASGSSALEIHKGSHDLSRRIIQYHLHGLSLREYIELKCGISFKPIELLDVLNSHEALANKMIKSLDETNQKILALFKSYLNHGFYPYFVDIPDVETYWITLEQNIRVTLESDLVAIYPQLTGSSLKKLKQLLVFIAGAVPFTPSWSKIKRIIDVADDRTVKNYFKYLEDASLIKSILSYSKNMHKLETSEKIYLNNPNQIQALSNGNGEKGNIRETFLLNMISPKHEIQLPLYGDFIINGKYTIEVGGRKKRFEQIKKIKNAYVANDEIELGVNQRIPLWLFGFLY